MTEESAPRVGVDVGGTFTDAVLVAGDGRVTTAKVPTTADQSEGVLAGIEKACERAGVAPDEVGEFAHAMTVSVNAVLERAGAETALVTTEGFRDVLEIGRQTRPSLYDLDAEKPAPLVPRRRRFAVAERATPDGIETPVDPEEIRALAADLRGEVESVAVAFLHAYAHPENEARAAAVLREELDVPVSASSEVLAEFREFERTATTVADAYVAPAIDAYVGRLAERAREAGLPAPRVMQSNGGIADADTVRARPVTTMLSGPAAGVVGANRAAGAAVAERDLAGLVTFDMGGTSSDVSLVRDGSAERSTDTVIDGVPVAAPMVDVHTIGSGGGSVASVDAGGALRVGPESAGAEPGPACYGKGGERATVTDANLVLGYIGDDAALGGELELDADAARDALARLAEEAGLDSAREAAAGVYRVANARMTRAVRAVTVERGHDPREFGLVAFGGAGPMHAAPLAGALDIDSVVVPPAEGVLSAYGLLAADEEYDAARSLLVPLSEADSGEVATVLDDLEAAARADATAEPTVALSADCRYDGQSFELDVPVERPFDADAVREAFGDAHERAYGYRADEPVELVTLRATARVPRDVAETAADPSGDPERGTRTAYFDGEARGTRVYDRDALPPGYDLAGPAVLEGTESTTVVPPGWRGTVRANGAVVLTEGSA
ncbi:hydantoinase/oxoprolinase family protein [Halosegnis marinus]|uniref:Hydantoinase/oxoprolinase family protein n=1 Tax=Halosegnis marinus TaxID=3034023 RepID=A0ABD5ZM09_9EURY|nr:hydantoinase/oxoprolinase family protein [Halosegnis sp. DT85]